MRLSCQVHRESVRYVNSLREVHDLSTEVRQGDSVELITESSFSNATPRPKLLEGPPKGSADGPPQSDSSNDDTPASIAPPAPSQVPRPFIPLRPCNEREILLHHIESVWGRDWLRHLTSPDIFPRHTRFRFNPLFWDLPLLTELRDLAFDSRGLAGMTLAALQHYVLEIEHAEGKVSRCWFRIMAPGMNAQSVRRFVEWIRSV